MLYSVEKEPKANIIIVTYQVPFQPRMDIQQAQAQIANMLGGRQGKWVRIDDLSAAPMDWATFVAGIDEATRDVPGSMTDPRIQGVLVGEGDMMRMAADSMKQEQYGATDTPMFASLEEALAFAHEYLEE